MARRKTIAAVAISVVLVIAWVIAGAVRRRHVYDIALPKAPNWRIRPSHNGESLACLNSSGRVTIAGTARGASARELVKFDSVARDASWSADDQKLAITSVGARPIAGRHSSGFLRSDARGSGRIVVTHSVSQHPPLAWKAAEPQLT